jgi:hypothetical protein
MDKPNNGGLPVQQISGGPARNEAIKQFVESNERQLSLIGGKKRRIRKLYIRGGASNTPITPPIVPNTGSSAETRNSQQDSYNSLAKLSGSVNEQSRYDKVGGRRRRRKSRKHAKSGKSGKSGKRRKNKRTNKNRKSKRR